MKKSLILATMLASAVVVISGCSKEDTEAPVITLLGNNPDQLEMRTTYNDPGATAEDNEDGDLSSSILVDDSELENRLPGSYSIVYSVSDAAGNVGTATRTVDVYATANALTGNYNVVDSCGSGASLQVYTYSQSISANNSSTIGFNLFADYSGNTGITATIASNGVITIPTQSALNIGSLSEDHDFFGSGSVTVNGFILNYTDRNVSAVPVATTACRATFTR